MYIKRVILANNSRLLLEMFQRALGKAEHLEIVREIDHADELPFAIQLLCPDWVIVSLPISDPVLNWIRDFLQGDPSVRFIFLSSDNHSVTMKGQIAFEEDLSNTSLKEFIYLLERDLQQN